MILAMDAVKNDGMSKKCAAKKFGVPGTTLKRRLEKNLPKRKMGPETILSGGEAQLLANWILSMGRKAFPVHATNLLSTVHKIMKETGRQTFLVKLF
ncbi:CENP-B N-terminal DNA-binding domain [Popillia japonica]|uniref:CENP-B N-terminal DNA-binding domain n=1 Tax=Popillia japonica TaxID=7064 RepID=A0AAW1L9W8_POPJA